MAEWTVDTDPAKNRLYIDLSGHFTPEEAAESTAEITSAAEGMAPGFEVITDISEFVPGDKEAVDYIEEGKQAIKDTGAAAAVRVMAEASATSQMHFERVGEDQEEYAVAMADSVDQAEQLLDSRGN